MAEKRKGCGFLIAAIVATIIAVIVAVVGVMGAKDAVENVTDSATVFATPDTGTFTANESKNATVWLSSSTGSAPAKPTSFTVKVQDEAGKDITVSTSSATTTVMNQVQLASFPVTKGSKYSVSVTGIPSGSAVSVSHASGAEAVGGIFKAAGGIFVAFALGFVAFVLGLIGLIRWLTSKPKAPTPAV